MMKLLLAVLVIQFLLFSTNFAQTNISGIIAQNTTWTLNNSPYLVTGNILVNESVILTIEAGVVIRFLANTAIQINGELIARGTPSSQIVFTSNAGSPAAGDWGYIFFSNSARDALFDLEGNYLEGSILEYVTVEYAGGVAVDNRGAIRLDNSHPFINYATVQHNSAPGIRGENLSSLMKISNCTLQYNSEVNVGGGISIFISIDSDLIITDNQINNNYAFDGAGIYLDTYRSAIVSGNIIKNNTTYGDGGGGIYVNGLDTKIFQNLIIGNSCGTIGNGGGINVLAGIPLDIYNNIILNNSAGMGGGIYCYGIGEIGIHNNILAYNQATPYLPESPGGTGGAIYIYTPGQPWGLDPNITAVWNNSILFNTANNAPALDYWSNDILENQIYRNTIFGNKATGNSPLYTIALNSHPGFSNNNLWRNNDPCILGNLNIQETGSLTATLNWWGTESTDDIPSLIWDFLDDGSLEVTNYSPYLSLPDTAAPLCPPEDVTINYTPGGAQVSWSPDIYQDLAGYKVYFGLLPDYQFQNSVDVGNTTEFFIAGITPADTIAVTAYDNLADGSDDFFEGHESWFAFPSEIAGLEKKPANIINSFYLKQNFPNPFNPSTTIEFNLPKTSQVTLKIFNILGEKVATLVSEKLSAGTYSYKWNALNLASGSYLYRLEAEGYAETRKMILMR